MRQLILDIRPDSPPDFANYLAGPNAEAASALQTMCGAARPFSGEHVIYLWGDAGVGKSHLLQAWSVRAQAPFYPAGQLPDQDMAMLAADNVDALGEADQIRLFTLLNAAREAGGRVVAAGRLPPSQLGIRPDLATRLAQGLVFRIHPLPDAEKASAMSIRAEAHGMSLDADLIRYMLIHCRRDLPHLLATVDALDSLSVSRKRPVSLPLLKELLLESSQSSLS